MLEVISLAELKADLASLQRARRMGVSTVTYNGNGVTRTVNYKSDREMQAAIADLLQRIAELEGTGKPRNIVVRGLRGW